MPRFFVEKERISEKEIIIDGSDAHHIARSLRMAEGDEVTICDGSGKDSCVRTREWLGRGPLCFVTDADRRPFV